MSFSYSAITNYGKVSLPSTEGALGQLHITRDPPKSIHTRRIDKVGSNNDVINMIQDSGDRICESISKYARGVDPMVSVSYSNYGNNGGQGSSLNAPIQQKQAFLPNALGSLGGFQFIPPVLRQENLLPLSRLPRLYTQTNTNPEFIDFSKKLQCPLNAVNGREIKTSMNMTVKPNKVLKIEVPIKEPFEVKYVIQNPIRVSGDSRLKPSTQKYQEQVDYGSGIIDIPLHADVHTNQNDSGKYVNTSSEKNTDRYIQNVITTDVHSNISTNKYSTPIGEVMDVDTKMFMKDHLDVSYETLKSSSSKGGNEYIHTETDRKRNLPSHTASTNTGSVKQVFNGNSEYKLPSTLQKGEFTGRGTIPSFSLPHERDEIANRANIISGRNTLLKKTAMSFQDRMTPVN